MSKLKVGDKVKYIGEYYKSQITEEWENGVGIITGINRHTLYCGVEIQSGTYENNYPSKELELIKSNNKIMDIKEKFVALFTKEPEKSYIKAGLMDNDKIVTDEGVKIFISYAMTKTELGEVFKKEVVDEIVKEEKGDK